MCPPPAPTDDMSCPPLAPTGGMSCPPLVPTDDVSPGEKPLRRSSCLPVASSSSTLVILVAEERSRARTSLWAARTCSEAHARLQGLQASRDRKESIWPVFYLFHSPALDIAQHMCARGKKLYEKQCLQENVCEQRKYIKIRSHSTGIDISKHGRSLQIVNADKNELKITLQCGNTDSGVNSINHGPVTPLC